jgi:hypothetical protein
MDLTMILAGGDAKLGSVRLPQAAANQHVFEMF